MPSVALSSVPSEHQAQIDLLLGTMVQPFDPASYTDTHLDSITALLARQAGRGRLACPRAPTADRTPRADVAPVLDLSSLLAQLRADQCVDPTPWPRTTRRLQTVAA